MEDLKSKKKQELIKIALEIIKEKQPSVAIVLDDFESTAWRNSKEIIVKFRRYIRFIPINSVLFQNYDITVNLITKQILPFESGYNFTFYIPTEEDKKQLKFIKEKAVISNQSESEITITENEEYYWISNKSKTSFSKFFIDKKNGFKSDVLEDTYSISQSKPVLESIYEREEVIQFFDENESTIKTKKGIINMAVILLNKKYPLLSLNFDDYEVTVNGDSKNTLVDFRRIIRYIPLGTNPDKRFSYDIKVNLNTNEISPFDDDKLFKSEFYMETKEDKKAIEFVKKNFGPSASFENTVYESEDAYFINSKNQYSFGKYSLNKKTFEVKSEIQGSLEPIPFPNRIEEWDILAEIK